MKNNKKMETIDIIDKVLAYIGERAEERRVAHMKSLYKRYDIETEARMSEDGIFVAIAQGLRNNLHDVQKKLGL
jgi:hypothetical protein